MSCPGVSHEATDCGFWSCCTQRLYRLLVGCSVFRLGSRTCKLSNRTRMRRSAVAFLRSLGAGASGSTETAVSKLSQQVMQGRRSQFVIQADGYRYCHFSSSFAFINTGMDAVKREYCRIGPLWKMLNVDCSRKHHAHL